ncbi:hypothetical protein B484DRAFT_408281 [Ochromonadaceae sp. CCMP2298]|nr:hypothetical protein B484DRAFT_408281 [Ochromonadaceae sp. CCMP2298]
MPSRSARGTIQDPDYLVHDPDYLVEGVDSLPNVTDVLKKDGVKMDDMEFLTAGPQERLKEKIQLAKKAAKFIKQA